MANERTASLNYEAEYNKLREEVEHLKAKNEWMHQARAEQEKQLDILRAQMEVVRLIFGGGNDGK